MVVTEWNGFVIFFSFGHFVWTIAGRIGGMLVLKTNLFDVATNCCIQCEG